MRNPSAHARGSAGKCLNTSKPSLNAPKAGRWRKKVRQSVAIILALHHSWQVHGHGRLKASIQPRASWEVQSTGPSMVQRAWPLASIKMVVGYIETRKRLAV